MKLPHKEIRIAIKIVSIVLFLFSIAKTAHKIMKNGGTDSDGTIKTDTETTESESESESESEVGFELEDEEAVPSSGITPRRSNVR